MTIIKYRITLAIIGFTHADLATILTFIMKYFEITNKIHMDNIHLYTFFQSSENPPVKIAINE